MSLMYLNAKILDRYFLFIGSVQVSLHYALEWKPMAILTSITRIIQWKTYKCPIQVLHRHTMLHSKIPSCRLSLSRVHTPRQQLRPIIHSLRNLQNRSLTPSPLSTPHQFHLVFSNISVITLLVILRYHPRPLRRSPALSQGSIKFTHASRCSVC